MPISKHEAVRIQGLSKVELLQSKGMSLIEGRKSPNSVADELLALSINGQIERPSDYGDTPYVYTKILIEDGADNQLLTQEIAIDAPVRLLQGQADIDVPWALSLEISEKLRSGDVQVYLVKDGDHRLSRPEDLALLISTVQALLEHQA